MISHTHTMMKSFFFSTRQNKNQTQQKKTSSSHTLNIISQQFSKVIYKIKCKITSRCWRASSAISHKTNIKLIKIVESIFPVIISASSAATTIDQLQNKHTNHKMLSLAIIKTEKKSREKFSYKILTVHDVTTRSFDANGFRSLFNFFFLSIKLKPVP